MRRLRPRSAVRLTLLALVAGALAACGGGAVDYGTGVVGGGTGQTGGGGGGSQAQSPLAGRWWRYESFVAGGAARTSETFWDFRTDGTAARTLITTNLTEGLAEALVWNGRWRQVGGEVEVTYTSPVTGTVRFFWRLDRGIDTEVLFLNEISFRRLQ